MPSEIVKTLAAGNVIGDRFRLEALVGSGGMGFVWRATSLETGEVVALKFLNPEGAIDDSAKRRMRREAKAAMAVRHPNVVRIHDIISGDDDEPIIVMEFLTGETLHTRLTRHDGPLDLATCAETFLPVLSAVGAAHAAGVVHRDLKPENIWLVTTPDGKSSPRVLDFGIAKIVGPNASESTAALTTTGGMLGTPRYMAPEQVFGEKDIDHRADVWSLGVMAYECLSGKRPIPGDNVWHVLRAITSGDIVPLATVAPSVPPTIAKIVMQMLSVDRKQRPDDLVSLYDALRPYSLVEATPVPHAVVDAETRAVTAVKSRGRRLVVVATSVALVLGVAAFARRPAAVDRTAASGTSQALVDVPVVQPPEKLAANKIEVTTTVLSVDTPATSTTPRARVPSAHPVVVASAASASAPLVAAPSVTVDPFHGLAVDAPF